MPRDAIGIVSPSQSNPGDTIEASDINNPINQLAAVVNGNIDSSNLASNAVVTAGLADASVSASKLTTSAITLGYAQITAPGTSTSATGAALTTSPISVTVTIPSGGRKIKITVYAFSVTNSVASGNYGLQIWDGTVGSGTQLQAAQISNNVGGTTSANMVVPVTMIAVVTPGAGSKTYNVGGFTSSGTITVGASATTPSFILVEAI